MPVSGPLQHCKKKGECVLPNENLKKYGTLLVVEKTLMDGLGQPAFKRDGQLVAIGVECPVAYDIPTGSDIGH